MCVKWTKTQLQSLGEELSFEERLNFEKDAFKNYSRLLDIRNVTVKGFGHYDQYQQRFNIELEIAGDMIVPCAVTLEEVLVPLDIVTTESFSFVPVDDEEVHYCKNDIIDLYPVIFQLMLLEVPLKVVKEDLVYPKGDGWEVVSEQEYERQKGDKIDPRLAKLKEFKFEEQ